MNSVVNAGKSTTGGENAWDQIFSLGFFSHQEWAMMMARRQGFNSSRQEGN